MNARLSRIGLNLTRGQVIGGGLLVLLLAAASVPAVHYTPPLLAGPALTQLVVTGKLVHVQPQAVQQAVRTALGSGFFTTHVESVRAAVAALPWVASVSVRRSWPHTLYVDITEEQPVVRWNGDGLMDAEGRVFVHTSDSTWAKLPVLNGPEGSEQDVLAEYRTFAALLAPRSLSMRQLSVNERGDTDLQLDDGLEVRLGRDNAELRLERFVSVALPTLGAQLANVAYVDMRYTNGFAVGYLPPCRWHGGGSERRGRGEKHNFERAAMPGSPGPLAQQDAERSGAAGNRTLEGSAPCTPDTEAQPND
jgi:cell division protein FtsQ